MDPNSTKPTEMTSNGSWVKSTLVHPCMGKAAFTATNETCATNTWQGVVVHTCNSSTRKAEAGRLRVLGQPGLYSETLPQKKKKI
jgi:hypothetical protein